MTLLEKLRNAGISDEDIITIFQYKAGGCSKSDKRSYSFGSNKQPDRFWGTLHFNANGVLFKIDEGPRLASDELQTEFINEALQDIYGEHGFIVSHRVLFSRLPLQGIFQWQDKFRIKPCLNTSQIGKGLAWGIDRQYLSNDKNYLGPPYPFILEVRIKKSPNQMIQTDRVLQTLDFYEWTMGLLLPQMLASSSLRNGEPKWIMLQNNNAPEYHLAYEAFNAHESDIETGDTFSDLKIPEAPRYSGDVEYYNHLWSKSSTLELPIDLEIYLNAIDNLSNDQKENFRRSIYWFNTGSKLYRQEQLSIIPFTTAIECLLPNIQDEVCPTCNKSKGGGPTKLFKEFMEKHLSLPENIDHLKKSIYNKRSTMVHGGYAFASDERFFSIEKFDQSEFIAESFIRRAIVNWLITGNLEK